ncbi:MAG: hypothetical protein HKN16_04725, partial [Saprospiraceae bacterium]|nr:hypothetical protein [Saprospiraceae bacterium]
IHGRTTVLRDHDSISYFYFDFVEDLSGFEKQFRKKAEDAKSNYSFNPAEQRHDLIHYSSVPWISFTQVKHARRIPAADCIPKLVFGKYYKEGEKVLMPFSVSVHHSLVDGLHVGQYFEKFQKYLNDI